MPPADIPALRDAFVTPATKRTYVRRLFSVIADRYDLITVLLSYGQDHRWKRRLVSMAPVSPGPVLDLACGTGDIAFQMAAGDRRVVGLDITPRMLHLARNKQQASVHPVTFVVGDMMTLPFPDASFTIVTVGYGLRNVPRLANAIVEIQRVLVPGGRLLSLDFDRPANLLVRGVYLMYLTVVGSVLGAILHGDPDTYRYIPESIKRYPGARAVCSLIRHAGFSACTHRPVLGGLMAIHSATK